MSIPGPWLNEPPEDEPVLSEVDAAFEADAERRRAVARRVWDLRVAEEAKAELRAEKVTTSNFDDLFLTRTDLVNLPAPEPLIERILPRHSYAVLRGRDHSFKSFVAIDWACALATGRPWQGHTTDPTRVLYIAGEGAHGLRSRIDAWEYAWGALVPADMLTVRATALNLHQPGPAFDHLLTHLAAGGYGLVIVDTLRRVSGAADGNSSEMGAVIDNLDRIKHTTDRGTVLVVAHTDKGDHDTRGYSGIEDDADVVWAARRDDMDLTLELTKMKDGPDGRTLYLQATRTLGSLTLTGTQGHGEINTNDSQLKILDAVRVVPEDKATSAELQSVSGLPKSTYYRALKDLTAAGHLLLEKAGRTTYYRLPDDGLDQTHDDPDTHPETDTTNPDDPLPETD